VKIEIDLDNIFRDEDGNPEEGLEESIRRQIIDRLSGDLRKKLFARLDIELSEVMREQINAVMKTQMPSLIDDIMNATYTPVSSYGQKGLPTTFRTEIIESVAKNMKYEPKSYSSEENAFTRAVKSIVEAKTGEVKKELLAQVDTNFKNDAINFAVIELSKRLGLTK
jgi:hypothetical protein